MKKLMMPFLIMILMFVLAACGTGDTQNNASEEGNEVNETVEESVEEEVTIKHQLDETTVKKNPEKVVVFDFGTLDTLDKLGIEVTALPKMNVPKYLSKYEDDKYENVGSLKEPDFEKIHQLSPDLIIISGRQMDLYDQFKEIAPTIFLGIDAENFLASFTENAITIGKIFDKEDVVEKELVSIQEKIESLNEKATNIDEKALIVLTNDGKVSAYGAKSRFGFIHDVFGIPAVDDSIEVSTHGQSISFEYIVEKNPDYLFVIDRSAVVEGNATAKEMLENDLVQKTNAYQNDKIVYLDADYWYLSGGGLDSVSRMIDEVDQAVSE